MATQKVLHNTKQRFIRRKARSRNAIAGRVSRPRLSVHRSLKHTNAQIIDDQKNVTLLTVTEKELSAADQKKNKTERARAVGNLIAKKAQEKSITEVVFDRSGYQYHGRIQALAEGAREGGLKF